MGNQKKNPPNLSTSNLPTEQNEISTDASEEIIKPPQKNYSKIIKLGVQIAGPLLTAIGLWVGVWQFQVQQRITDEQEFKRRIWEKRLEAYMEIGDLAAQLMTSTNNKKKFDSLHHRFEQMYWGKLPLFEDSLVESRMKLFGDELYSVKMNEGDTVALKRRGYFLMHACQESLKNH